MTRQWPRRARLVAATVGVALVAAAGAAPVTAASGAGEAVAWTHNPASPTGPAAWGGLDRQWKACASSTNQSPIVITTTWRARLPALLVDYRRTPLIVKNIGHVVEVPQPAGGGGNLVIGGHGYRLVQWHVHAPGEHVVDGHRADMEIHLVHQDARGDTAVLAVLADVAWSSHRSAPRWRGAADLLRTALRAAPSKAGEETDVGQKVSAALLLGTGVTRSGRIGVVGDYLTYTGSLTTPPCSTGVRWFVLPRVMRVDHGSVERLHALVASFPGYDGYPDNNRPVQPLGSRSVKRRLG